MNYPLLTFCFQKLGTGSQVIGYSIIEITQKINLQTIKPHYIPYWYPSTDFLESDIRVCESIFTQRYIQVLEEPRSSMLQAVPNQEE